MPRFSGLTGCAKLKVKMVTLPVIQWSRIEGLTVKNVLGLAGSWILNACRYAAYAGDVTNALSEASSSQTALRLNISHLKIGIEECATYL